MQNENKKHYEVVAAVIVKKSLDGDSFNNRIFCAQRPGAKPGKEPNETNYKWEFPGGKIEKGETREAALVREIREEFGAEIEVNRFIMTVEHEYKNFAITMHAFYCTLKNGELELKEHVESAWLKPEQLPLLHWAPADVPIMRHVQKECASKPTDSVALAESASEEIDGVSLRVFAESDMEQFISWLSVPHVAKWYTPASAWIDEVSSRDAEYSWITHYVITANNADSGFCQFYPFALSGETWNGTISAEGTYSLDYFVGNANLLRQGIARRALCHLCALIRLFSSARRIIVQPEAENIASQKTLLAAGFLYDEKNALFILEWN